MIPSRVDGLAPPGRPWKISTDANAEPGAGPDRSLRWHDPAAPGRDHGHSGLGRIPCGRSSSRDRRSATHGRAHREAYGPADRPRAGSEAKAEAAARQGRLDLARRAGGAAPRGQPPLGARRDPDRVRVQSQGSVPQGRNRADAADAADRAALRRDKFLGPGTERRRRRALPALPDEPVRRHRAGAGGLQRRRECRGPLRQSDPALRRDRALRGQGPGLPRAPARRCGGQEPDRQRVWAAAVARA